MKLCSITDCKTNGIIGTTTIKITQGIITEEIYSVRLYGNTFFKKILHTI